ncbi:MAG: hypothetical protein R3324_00130 [Halobacteriales archaeon]|nr:hypothetical protein [Halobacteriales archaeon]
MITDKLPADDEELENAVVEFVTAKNEREQNERMDELLSVTADRNNAIVTELVVKTVTNYTDFTKKSIEDRLSQMAAEEASAAFDFHSMTRLVAENGDEDAEGIRIDMSFEGERAEMVVDGDTLTSPSRFVAACAEAFDTGLPFIGKRSEWIQAVSAKMGELEIGREMVNTRGTPDHEVVRNILESFHALVPTDNRADLRGDPRAVYYDPTEDPEHIEIREAFITHTSRETTNGAGSFAGVVSILEHRGYVPEGWDEEPVYREHDTVPLSVNALLEGGYITEAQL